MIISDYPWQDDAFPASEASKFKALQGKEVL